MDAIEGEDAEEFGHRIFDLSKEGVSFKIKCENQGEYPTYVSSRFTATGKLNLSEDEQKKIYDSVFDLTKVFPLKSADELKQMLDEHYHCKSAEEAPVREIQREAVKTPQAPTPAPVVASDEEDAYDDIDDLLKDL